MQKVKPDKDCHGYTNCLGSGSSRRIQLTEGRSGREREKREKYISKNNKTAKKDRERERQNDVLRVERADNVARERGDSKGENENKRMSKIKSKRDRNMSV